MKYTHFTIEERIDMNDKVLVSLLITTATATGGWYCFVVYITLIVAALKNIRKRR